MATRSPACATALGRRQITPLQLRPGQLERRSELHAEHPAPASLLVSRGQQLDRLIMMAGLLVEQAERHQCVGVHPGRIRGLGGGRGLLGPGLRRGRVAQMSAACGHGWPAHEHVPSGAGPRAAR